MAFKRVNLAFKTTLAAVAFFILFSAILAFVVEELYVSYAKESLKKNVELTVRNRGAVIGEYLKKIESFVTGVADLIKIEAFQKRALRPQHFELSYTKSDGFFITDTSRIKRTIYSGVLVYPDANLSEEEKTSVFEIDNSLARFGRAASRVFLDVYFLAKANYLVIYPPRLVYLIPRSFDYRKSYSFKTVKKQKFPGAALWSPVYYDSILKKKVITRIVPIFKNKQFFGAAAVDFDLEKLPGILKTFQEKNVSRYFCYLVNKNNEIIAARGSKAKPDEDEKAAVLNVAKKFAKNKATFKIYSGEISDKLIAAVKIKPFNWMLLGVALENETVVDSNKIFYYAFLIALGISVIIVLAFLPYINRTFVSPLSILSRESGKAARGEDIDLSPIERRNDEIGDLARAFKAMSENIRLLLTRLQNDIQLLKEDKKEIEKRESILATIFNSSPTPMALVNNGIIEKASPSFAKELGYAPEELLGKKERLIFSDDVSPQKRQELENRLNRESSISTFSVLKRKNGKTFDAIVSVALIEKTKANRRFIVSFADVDALKKAKEKAEFWQNRYEMALEVANDGFWDWDLRTNQSYFSAKYFEMLGYPPNETSFSRERFLESLHPEDKPLVLETERKMLEEDADYNVEFRMKTKSGQWKWLNARAKVVERDENGNPLRVIGVHTDIHERKVSQEKELIELATLESSLTPIAIFDLYGKAYFFNNAAMEFWKFEPSDIENLSITRLGFGDIGKILRDLRDKGHFKGEAVAADKYGTKKDVELFLAYVFDKDKPIKIAASCFDITERKNYERKLARLNEELEEKVIARVRDYKNESEKLAKEIERRKAIEEELKKYQDQLTKTLEKEKNLNKLKTNFVTMVSHRYKTPLTIIQASAELIRRRSTLRDFESLPIYVQRIEDAVEKMTEMLDNVITLSKIDEGEKNVRISNFTLKEILDGILPNLTALGGPRKIIIEGDESISFVSDKLYVKNVVYAVYSNAWKYSKENSRITTKIVDKVSFVEIQVRDEGIGIPKDELNAIFDYFVRGSNVSHIPGSGLGLSIAKRALETLGGNIYVESELGAGTFVTIIIPKRFSSIIF